MKNDLGNSQQPPFCQSCGMPLSNDILVSEYGKDSEDAEIVVLKKR